MSVDICRSNARRNIFSCWGGRKLDHQIEQGKAAGTARKGIRTGNFFMAGSVAGVPLLYKIIRQLQKRVLSRCELESLSIEQPEAKALGVVRQVLDLRQPGTMRVIAGKRQQYKSS